MGLIFLQIGIIGHGLFKNYSLGVALGTTCLISLINFEPKTVLAMFILIGILTFFYYRTGSFEIVILGTLVYFLIDLLLLQFIDFNVMAENNYRYVILGNDVAYFGVMLVSVLLLLFLMRQVGQLKQIQWKQKTELIEY
ncbi:hypothetical protein AFM12_07545 [Jiulongibacter sediminis]|uniref:Uncharacterized protein n=2 Tax=Jiulongibacter sediminis TaxID=1605367 RepID=A0A0N8H9W1_9BACT|nr:hypothetical protein AFM12_07545 [Jiulongibacter sediminis]TBX25015.1 hypothetical protein TK44_07550 [Jiulongibacter sediminis]